MELRTTQVTAGDLTWRIAETGAGGRPVLFLHGFSGDGRFWLPVARGLEPRPCILPDLPGHGGTTAPLPPGAWSLDRAAGALVDALDRIGIGRCDLVGYSMGGRLALQLALRHGSRVERLVLVGASCGLESPVERAQRVASDEDLASRLESEGIEAFVERWEALPLFASQKELPEAVRDAMRAARIAQEPFALAAALRAFGLGAQSPVGGALARLSMPVLLVAGGKDSKYCRIAEHMGERIAGSRVAIVPDAGHAVPLEKPDEFSVLLAAFLGPPQQRRDRAHE
jgi:2-succinyl-6-hydroxy-2,4-cyclohexadiene-1-carboxylate synthase